VINDELIIHYSDSLANVLPLAEVKSFFANSSLSPIKNIEEIKINEPEAFNLILVTQKDLNLLTKNLESKNWGKILYVPEEDFSDDALSMDLSDLLQGKVSAKKLIFSVNKTLIELKNRKELAEVNKRFNIQSKELKTLNSIGISLSTERNVEKLLKTILFKCREITDSDSGSLYIVEEVTNIDPDPLNYFSNKKLIFKLAQNSTISVDFTEQILELNKKSIAGYVALTGQPLLIKDSYNLPDESEFSHNRSFDEAVGYRCKSMLIVPMRNQKDEIIGVIQLINKKTKPEIKLTTPETVEEFVCEFDQNDRELVYSLASQAAILIDNTKLYHSIRNLFEGFIRASVTAIESRDPTTSGHSERVATLTVNLAQKVDQISEGKLALIKFNQTQIQQIKYASLLHDFGKIGVREDVLVKAKKLYPDELEIIQHRLSYIKKCLELNRANDKINYLLNKDRDLAISYFSETEKAYLQKIEEIDQALSLIISANEPSILAQEASDHLHLIANMIYDDQKQEIPYLTNYELESLSISKGSLRENERLEIESHVTHTFEFLRRIPWTNDLKIVPEIAYSHHEKLDGSGYPRKIKAENIPIQAKMMAIADIYDALTASDRPYKRALPAEKALDILGFEVKANKLDPDLFKVFVEGRVYQTTSG